MKQSSIDPEIVQRFLSRKIHHQREYFMHPPYVIEKRLFNSIIAANCESAVTCLDKINTLERAVLAEEPVRSLKNSLICSCTLMTRAAIEGGMPPEVAFNLSDAYIQEIERKEKMTDLSLLEYTMLEGFIRKLKEARRSSRHYSHAVHLAIEYIQENSLQDFSLENLASHVYLNPAYLSHLFKKEVGTSITDFINRVKTRESVYFLLHTNNSISEVALLFHFCNQSYYTTVFKKYFGMTPSQFRKQRGEEGRQKTDLDDFSLI
ncbi:AraC family transcriptional regulator [Sporolactobacillus sp. Y61]|uniref:AraC family transcriptional regulator n=1 Tax=Sporolactobacillus sp. Y61 TaxID=3160863 RepID=A0AAU8IDE4_9BACL